MCVHVASVTRNVVTCTTAQPYQVYVHIVWLGGMVMTSAVDTSVVKYNR